MKKDSELPFRIILQAPVPGVRFALPKEAAPSIHWCKYNKLQVMTWCLP